MGCEPPIGEGGLSEGRFLSGLCSMFTFWCFFSGVLELLVRMEKVLERTGRGKEIIEIRNVRIDRKEHQVMKAGIPVALKPMEYEVLVLLAANKNVAFSREQLLNL